MYKLDEGKKVVSIVISIREEKTFSQICQTVIIWKKKELKVEPQNMAFIPGHMVNEIFSVEMSQ